MSKVLEFSELLMTKFCHDIAGSIGAINNGIEFLKEGNDEEIKSKALGIIHTNGAEAASKLVFFRYIYGVVKSEGQVDINELKTLVRDFFKGSKIAVHWNNYDTEHGVTQVTGRGGKLLLNMIFLASSTLIAGGDINIDLTHGEHSKKMLVTAVGEKLKITDDIKVIIHNKELMDIKLSNVQIHLTSKVAASLNVVLGCEYDDNKLVLDAVFS
jgi:histidine phosphotransferase ChpT